MPPPGGIPKKRVVKKTAARNPDAADRNAEARNVTPTKTSTPDSVDRNRDARRAPTPAVVQKERVFAHPSRPNNRKVIRKAAKAQAKADYDATERAKRVKEDRAETRRVVSKIDAHPTPSPDALDTVRSPQQKESDAEFTARNIKTIRQRVVAKRGSLAITRGVKKELEGKGELAKVLGKLGDNAAKKSGGTGAGLTFASIPGQRHSGSKAGEITANAYKDLVNLPAQVIPSVYVPVAGVVEAAKGRPERIKKFAKDIDESDPVFNLAAAGVNAAKGNLPAAGKRLRKARDAAEGHPGFAAAEVVGVKGMVGRGVGRTARRVGKNAATKGGTVRTAAAKVGSTQREAATLPGTSLKEERTYSPDTTKKAVQVVVEKTRKTYAKHVRRLGDEAKARGETEHATDLHEKAAKIDPVKPITEKQILRRVDEHVDAMETVRRMHRGEVVNETRAAVKEAGADKAGPVASLVTQGIVHADPADIRAYISELKGEFTGLSNHGKRANKQLVKGLEKALKDHGKGKVDFGKLEKLAADYRKGQEGREKALNDRGMIAESEAQKAAAIPYAVRRMKARHTDEHNKAAATATKESLDHARSRVAGLEREQVAHSAKSKVTRGRDSVKEQQAVYHVGDKRFETRAEADAYSKAGAETPDGYVRLYRGDGVVHHEVEKDWPDAPEGGGNSQGRWFTDAPERAKGYSSGGMGGQEGLDGFVTYVDVPAAVAKAAHHSTTQNGETYVLPAEWAADAVEHVPGSHAASVAHHLKREASSATADALMHRRAASRAKVEGTEPPPPFVARPKPEPARVRAAPRGRAGGEVRKLSLTRKEAARVGEASRIDRALEAAREDVARLERKHSSAHAKRNVKELVDEHGKPLSLNAIFKHMEDNGEPIPSWLSQAPNSRGARNFFQSSTRAADISTEARTGEATRGGTFDAHPDTLVEGAARQQTLKDAFDGFHAFLDEFGLKGKGGKIKTVLTKKQADNAIREAMVDEHGDPRPGAIKWVAVRANPLGGRSDQLAKMLEGTDNVVGGKNHIDDAIHAALGGDGEGPWAIVPEAAASRLQEHVRVLNPGNTGKLAQKANSNFRKTVLSTSIPWLTGNIVEGGTRATLAGAGPRSFVTGHRVLKRAREIDKEMGERSTARTVGGGHFGSAERQHIHLNVDAMKPGAMKTIAKSLGAFWRAPGPKHVADLWHGYTHVVMNTVNRAIETQIQTAMLGKAVHDSELMDAPLMRASEAAVDKAARGVLDQNTAVALGRQLDIMYGKYGKWSPDMRKQVALYTPFVAWTLNATYFILRTMPRDHPTTTALIAATENATDEWRKDHGLDKFIDGALPAWLQGSIPGKGGSHYRAPGRYTPFGLGADPLGAYAGSVLPMLTGVIAAGKGKDWQGHDLKDQSDGGKVKAAVTSFLDASVPFLALGKRVAEKGVKAATVDATAGKVAPAKRKRAVSRRSSSKPGQIVGPGSSGGKIVGAGTSGGGKIVR